LEKLGLNLGYLLVQIFNFLILLVVLKEWVYKPILRLLEKRRQTIAQSLEDARIAAEARANAEKEAAKIIAEAQTKASQVVREATDRAESASKEVRAVAEAESAKARQVALAEVDVERGRMFSDLRSQVTALAIAAAQNLIGEALDEKHQHSLLDEFFSGIKSGKVVLLEDAEYTASSAVVTSALPLTDTEQAAVKKDILAKVGAKAVTFRVDPAILGGLVIRLGDKVVDGSVASRLEGMRQSLR